MQERKLYRSREDQMLGGVCGGIAEYLDMDPSVVRLLAVLLTLVGNAAAIVAYIVMWVVVPEEGADATPPAPVERVSSPVAASAATPPSPSRPPASPPSPSRPPASPSRPNSFLIWVGLVLVALGAALLVARAMPALNLWGVWPVTLVGLVFIAIGVRMALTREGDE